MAKSKKKASKNTNKQKNRTDNGENDDKNGVNNDRTEDTTATENLDTMDWLRYCETKNDANGEPFLQLEYQPGDEMMKYLQRFLEESIATKQVVEIVYQIWQQTVLSTLLSSSKLWIKDTVTASDQRHMKEKLKLSRYKINFIMHHVVGAMLTSPEAKWKRLRDDLLQLCYQTLQLLPRLAESIPHHKTDIRRVIMHFEGKEFLASAACETWDTLYDFSIPIDPARFIPVLRRCAMLDILDKDWNMLGGWEDILKGLEAKCCLNGPVMRLPCDAVLHEHTTILRNARNSMQCKFFSVRFMRYTDDQAPQRWRYFPKCSAPACANIETPEKVHPFRCRKCWYFHYCSESCQEYCDNIMGLHPKFCGDTPASKAALCRKETETHLGWTDPMGDAIVCQACGTTEENIGSDGQMKRCSKCQKIYYCSRQCQEWDWRHGGHSGRCCPESILDGNSVLRSDLN
uniref:MYND-type domain-containing protein n=1 Tax=Amphora coffeiformis TaxID=265554 RepID=A0A7S3L4T4_9STRA|eukprot:scaffold40314_cov206-Amphora_coffeaeformis.AAC.3